MIGLQASGLFNLNGGETKAVQLSGLANMNLDDFQGVQATGLANINLRSADGVKFAGLMNFSNGRSVGASIAGLANIHVRDFKGPQIAGLTNISTKGKMYGSQISGLYNHGHKVYGTQIGFVNYADSLTGIPIGFLSIVKHGYHKLEVSADEVFYANLAFRSGARQFHNILMAGIQPQYFDSNNVVWSFGYGLGTARKITKWLQLNIDLSSQHVNKGSFTEELSSLNKLQVGFDFRLARGLSIYAGASLNSYLTKLSYSDYPTLFTGFKPKVFYTEVYGEVYNQMWFGGKVGLRFF